MAKRTADARSAGRGVLALGLFQSAGRALALAFLVIATHAVVPSDFGRYSTVAAVLLIVGFVSDLGTTTATTKLVSTGADSDALLTNSLLTCLLLGLGAWGIGTLIVAVGYPQLLVVDFAVLGATLPVDACLTTILGVLDGSGAIARRAVVSFLRVGVGALTASVLVVVTGSIRWALAGLVMGSVVGLIGAVVLALRLGLWRGRIHLSLRSGRPLLVAALPFAAISGLSVLNARIDVVTVSLVSTRATTAAYDVAVRVLEGPLFITGILSGPMLYLFSRRFEAADFDGIQRAYDRALRILFFIGVGISVIITTLATPIVALVFGGSYSKSGLLLTIFGAQLWLMFVCALQGMVIASMPHMRKAVVLIASLTVVQVTLQVTFILVAGPVGGAVSYSVGTVVTLVVFGTFLRRQAGLRTIRLPSWGVLIAVVPAVAIALFLRHGPVILTLIAAGLVYVIALTLTRSVGRRDLADLRQLLQRN